MAPSRDEVLVAASAHAEAEVRRRLDHVLEVIARQVGRRLVAVVLGGSLARGQGMVLREGDGLSLLSDLDLYVVCAHPDRFADAAVQRELQGWVQADAFLRAPLDLALVSPDYFERLGPTLPARQLAHGARVLHRGPSGSDWSLPRHGGDDAQEVDPDDARRLLLNRLAEGVQLRGGEHDPAFAAVHRMKQCLDAPLAWLAAIGRYHHSRTEQLRRLEELTGDWSGPSSDWARDGIAHLRGWRETVRAQPVSLERLRRFAALDQNGAPEQPDPVAEWVWPFLRALLDAAEHQPDPGASLRAAVEEGAAGPDDAPRVARWLRRRPWPARLRQARRWAPLAPVPVRPWWRHAGAGSGEERVYAAAALRWGGDPEWTWPLEGLLREGIIGRSERETDRRLGRLWADWILGGGRR